jgi:hypothetical protein
MGAKLGPVNMGPLTVYVERSSKNEQFLLRPLLLKKTLLLKWRAVDS